MLKKMNSSLRYGSLKEISLKSQYLSGLAHKLQTPTSVKPSRIH